MTGRNHTTDPIFRSPVPAMIALCLVFMGACTRDVQLDLPPHVPSLVVHGYVALGDTIRLSVSRTIGVQEPLPDSSGLVSSARCELFVDGVLSDTLRYLQADQLYHSDLLAAPDHDYRIRVAATGFQTVEAGARGLRPLPPATLTHAVAARQNTDGLDLDDVQFRFADPAGERNFYMAALYPAPRYPDMGKLCVYTYEPVIERFQGDLLPYDPGSCIGGEELLFTDRSFNGQNKSILVSAPTLLIMPELSSGGNWLRPYLKRYSISEDYYRYFKTTVAMGYNSGPSFTDPVTVKGNVTNGYGLFTIYAAATDTIR